MNFIDSNGTEHPSEVLKKAVVKPVSSPDEKVLSEVRDLRLWHWQELLKCRKVQAGAANTALWHNYEKLVSHHMRAVQTLNSFFPVGDTAERDHAADRQST